MPELFDLDSAFATLTEDVAERTHPRGAGDAIGASRKRRTALGASAAVALIAVGGAWIGLSGGDDRLSPVGETGLPAPALLDAAAMTAATSGWIPDWHAVGPDDEDALGSLGDDPSCFSDDGYSGESPEPTRLGSRVLVSSGGDVVSAIFADFGTTTAAGLAGAEIDSSMARCSATPHSVRFGEGTVTYYDASSTQGSRPRIWIATLGTSVGLLTVSGETTAPSDEAADEVARALLAALQVDETFKVDDSMLIDGGGEASGSVSVHPSASAMPPVSIDLSESDLDTALHGWSEWTKSGSGDLVTIPCVEESLDAPMGGAGTVGNGGQVSYGQFDTSKEASTRLAGFLAGLSTCNAADWTLDSTTVPDVVVASSDRGTVWATHQGNLVILFQIQGSGKPPADVAREVGKLVIGALTVG